MIKIISWNVNGIRNVYYKGQLDKIIYSDYNIICLQEIKLSDYKFLLNLFSDQYYMYYNISKQNGRNGVAIFTKIKPINVNYNLNFFPFDDEGRFIHLIFENFSIINLYMPHGKRDKSKLDYKILAAEKVIDYLSINKANTIIATDFNIAHKEIDLHNFSTNVSNIMFTSLERNIINQVLKDGFVDAFRTIYPYERKFTWWSYAFNCRERDIGWRIDYFFLSNDLLNKLIECNMLTSYMGSDHCPIYLIIKEIEYA